MLLYSEMPLVAPNAQISLPLLLKLWKIVYGSKTYVSYSANDHVLQSFEAFFQLQSKFHSVCCLVVRRLQTWKIDVFFRKSWTIGLREKGLLFRGKMMFCGWNLSYLELMEYTDDSTVVALFVLGEGFNYFNFLN